MPLEIAIPKELRKLALFGSGVGIEVAGKDLHVVAARESMARFNRQIAAG